MNKVISIVLICVCNEMCYSQTKPEAPKPRKFVHSTEFGFLLGEQSEVSNIYPQPNIIADGRYIYPPIYYAAGRSNTFTLRHFSGYKINEYFVAGVSAGLDYYVSNIITPLALAVQSQILPHRRISPIVNLDAGYGFIWNNKNDIANKYDKFGGLMANPSAGIRIKIGDDGSNININLGYRVQKSGYEYNLPEQNYYLKENRTFNRLSVRLGFGF